MNHQSLRTIIFVGIAALAPACLDTETDEPEATSEAISALSGTQEVCSWATIRYTKGGRVIGFLLPGDNFHIDHCTGTSPTSWCDGHAYGHLHMDGWIEVMHLQGC